MEQALRATLEAADHAAERALDESEVLDLWRALIAGQCSLVESLDLDGHRFLIVRRNAPDTPARTALSPAEARALRLRAQSASYKLIAHELELSTASAHGLVKGGMKKIGIREETELPRLFGTLPESNFRTGGAGPEPLRPPSEPNGVL